MADPFDPGRIVWEGGRLVSQRNFPVSEPVVNFRTDDTDENSKRIEKSSERIMKSCMTSAEGHLQMRSQSPEPIKDEAESKQDLQMNLAYSDPIIVVKKGGEGESVMQCPVPDALNRCERGCNENVLEIVASSSQDHLAMKTQPEMVAKVKTQIEEDLQRSVEASDPNEIVKGEKTRKSLLQCSIPDVSQISRNGSKSGFEIFETSCQPSTLDHLEMKIQPSEPAGREEDVKDDTKSAQDLQMNLACSDPIIVVKKGGEREESVMQCTIPDALNRFKRDCNENVLEVVGTSTQDHLPMKTQPSETVAKVKTQIEEDLQRSVEAGGQTEIPKNEETRKSVLQCGIPDVSVKNGLEIVEASFQPSTQDLEMMIQPSEPAVRNEYVKDETESKQDLQMTECGDPSEVVKIEELRKSVPKCLIPDPIQVITREGSDAYDADLEMVKKFIRPSMQDHLQMSEPVVKDETPGMLHLQMNIKPINSAIVINREERSSGLHKCSLADASQVSEDEDNMDTQEIFTTSSMQEHSERSPPSKPVVKADLRDLKNVMMDVETCEDKGMNNTTVIQPLQSKLDPGQEMMIGINKARVTMSEGQSGEPSAVKSLPINALVPNPNGCAKNQWKNLPVNVKPCSVVCKRIKMVSLLNQSIAPAKQKSNLDCKPSKMKSLKAVVPMPNGCMNNLGRKDHFLSRNNQQHDLQTNVNLKTFKAVCKGVKMVSILDQSISQAKQKSNLDCEPSSKKSLPMKAVEPNHNGCMNNLGRKGHFPSGNNQQDLPTDVNLKTCKAVCKKVKMVSLLDQSIAQVKPKSNFNGEEGLNIHDGITNTERLDKLNEEKRVPSLEPSDVQPCIEDAQSDRSRHHLKRSCRDKTLARCRENVAPLHSESGDSEAGCSDVEKSDMECYDPDDAEVDSSGDTTDNDEESARIRTEKTIHNVRARQELSQGKALSINHGEKSYELNKPEDLLMNKETHGDGREVTMINPPLLLTMALTESVNSRGSASSSKSNFNGEEGLKIHAGITNAEQLVNEEKRVPRLGPSDVQPCIEDAQSDRSRHHLKRSCRDKTRARCRENVAPLHSESGDSEAGFSDVDTMINLPLLSTMAQDSDSENFNAEDFEDPAQPRSHACSSVDANKDKDFSPTVPDQCIFCKKTFKSRRDAMLHVVKRHPAAGRVTCAECGLVLPSVRRLKEHSYSHTNNYPHRCNWCGKGFAVKYLLDDHIPTAHTGEKRHKCDICGNSFLHRSSLHTHKQYHGDPLLCATCGRSFFRTRDLEAHEATHGEKKFTCSTCKKSFHLKRQVLLHYQRVHGQKKSLSQVVCHICGKSVSKSKYKLHVETHSDEKNYSCKVCGTAFKRKLTLQKHERTHTGEKPHSCKTCGEAFTQHSSLKRHIKTKHSGDRPFACGICGKSFTQTNSLVRHKRIHTGERPFKCDKCDKSFIERYPLTVHMKTHGGEQ